jgi:hypothetical protein
MTAARTDDEEHLIEQVLTAIREIANGAKKTSSFRYGPFGQQGRIDRTLRAGSFLGADRNFNEEEYATVQAAFARFGSSTPSRSVRDCCHEPMAELKNQQA